MLAEDGSVLMNFVGQTVYQTGVPASNIDQIIQGLSPIMAAHLLPQLLPLATKLARVAYFPDENNPSNVHM